MWLAVNVIEAGKAAACGGMGSCEALQFLMSCSSSKPHKSQSILQSGVGFGGL
jgi:hypothetical protein